MQRQRRRTILDNFKKKVLFQGNIGTPKTYAHAQRIIKIPGHIGSLWGFENR